MYIWYLSISDCRDWYSKHLCCNYLPTQGCKDDLMTCLDELSAIIKSADVGSVNVIECDMDRDVGNLLGPEVIDVQPTRVRWYIVLCWCTEGS